MSLPAIAAFFVLVGDGIRRAVSQSPVAVHSICRSGLVFNARSEKKPRASALLPVACRVGQTPSSIFAAGPLGRLSGTGENRGSRATAPVHYNRGNRAAFCFRESASYSGKGGSEHL